MAAKKPSAPESFSQDQQELIIDALNIRMCVIETGTTSLRAIDAQTFNQTLSPRSSNKATIKILDAGQRKLITEMEDMITQLRKRSN